MQSVGNLLRAARVEVGLSLEDVFARTRISLRSLEAIEEDDMSAMPSSFFYKSFVTQFANALGIDPATLAPLLDDVIADWPEPLMPGQNERHMRNAVIRPLGLKRNFRWLYSLGSLVVVLVGCSAFYALWENAKGDVANRLTDLKSRVMANGSSGSSSDSSGRHQLAGAGQADGFRVELSALEPTWLSISSDGRNTFSGTLEPEQKKTLEGRERGRIKTGNAGGISFTFNGRAIGVVGPRGQVRTVVFTKDSYEVLGPEVGVALTSFNPISEWKPLSFHALGR